MYCIGDWIEFRINNDATIIYDVEFNDPRYSGQGTSRYECIGRDDQYYCVGVSLNVDGSSVVTDKLIARYEMDKDRHGDVCYVLHHYAAGSRKNPDYYQTPERCCLCKESVPYALPNQADKVTFICWSCRSDPRNIFKLKSFHIKES